jgi:murein DD-endopeptidase MepM/ murein hydrolase activator NlpD
LEQKKMPVFPLPYRPRLSYSTGGRRFGSLREGGRRHAACDLIVPLGTEIYAVEDGTLIGGPYFFYHGTYAIEVRHPNFIARYCEILDPRQGGIRLSSRRIVRGQVIAKVGRMYTDSMLHFEMYSGTATGGLTRRNRPPFMRRSDLIDPAPFLDSWAIRS